MKISNSLLADDYVYAYDKVREFFSADFRRMEAFQHQAELVRSRDIKREPLAQILLRQNQDYGCGSRTCDNIERLRKDQACAVVTGQQVGLFSGPLYTIYKSLTAIKLAEHLDENLSGSYVPVFWLASDDHDFAEIDHINLLTKDNEIEKIQHKSPHSDLRIPVSKLSLTQEVESCIQSLDALTRDSEFKPAILKHLSEAYRPGQPFAQAFGEWMTRLFKTFGLVFVDASHPELKGLGRKVFAKEIDERSPSTKKALETSNKLQKANYHTQIRQHEGILNLFLVKKERRSIQVKGDDFFVQDGKRTYKKSELLDILEEKPEMFSPNVLLRPVYQDSVLPTVATVGGPGEIAYFAQMKGVYDSFDVSMPVIYPRKSITVIEKNVDAVLRRLDIKIQDIWQNADGLVKTIVKDRIPAALDEMIHAAASHLEADFSALKPEIKAFDPTLEKSAEAALGKMNRQLRILENKITRTSRDRNRTVIQQLTKAINSLYPMDRLQERVFNILPFLIKYSYAFLEMLYENIGIDEFDHQVIRL